MSDSENAPSFDPFVKRQIKRHGLSALILTFAVFRVEAAQDATQVAVNKMAVDLRVLAKEGERRERTLGDHTTDLKDLERRLTRTEAQLNIARNRSSNSPE